VLRHVAADRFEDLGLARREGFVHGDNIITYRGNQYKMGRRGQEKRTFIVRIQ